MPGTIRAGLTTAGPTGDYATDLALGYIQTRSGPTDGNVRIAGPNPWIDLSATNVTVAGRAYALAADMTGATDSSAAGNNAVAALSVVRSDGQTGGMILIPAGSLGLANTWNVSGPQIRVAGVGSGSIVVPLSGGAFTNGLINVSGNQCLLENFMFRGTSQTPGNNPAADGIVFSGGNVTLRLNAIQAFYLNGWFFNFLSTATGYDVRMVSCNSRQCAKGVTADGTSATGLSPSITLMSCFMDPVAAGGDCSYFPAAHDIILPGCFGSALTSSGATRRAAGAGSRRTTEATTPKSSSAIRPSSATTIARSRIRRGPASHSQAAPSTGIGTDLCM